MISENLQKLRKAEHMSQEELAEKIGVSRQTVAKWESGSTLPDINSCALIAEVFGVSLDALVLPNSGERDGKYVFGTVTIGDRGQIVIPKKCRQIFGLESGDMLIVLGDKSRGIALMKLSADMFDNGDDNSDGEIKNE